MNPPGKVFLLLLLVLSLRSLSFGWGCSGHEIVALIAQRQLSDVAAQKVLVLLKSPGLYVNSKPGRGCNPRKYNLTNPSDLGLMAFYATFADDFRNTNKSTAPWHFWDVPLNSTTGPDLPQFCDKGCVVKAIQDQIDVLKSPSATKRARSKALALLIHFVGDLHQPLHIADNNDRGGNCVRSSSSEMSPRFLKAAPERHPTCMAFGTPAYRKRLVTSGMPLTMTM